MRVARESGVEWAIRAHVSSQTIGLSRRVRGDYGSRCRGHAPTPVGGSRAEIADEPVEQHSPTDDDERDDVRRRAPTQNDDAERDGSVGAADEAADEQRQRRRRPTPAAIGGGSGVAAGVQTRARHLVQRHEVGRRRSTTIHATAAPFMPNGGMRTGSAPR